MTEKKSADSTVAEATRKLADSIVPPAKRPWDILSAINVSERIEKKNGLSYLSWAWAWAELKKVYPLAWFRKHETGSGFPCFHDVQGYAFVKVTVGLDRSGDHEVTELLPVLDHRNKPIQGPNAFEVNNALQRCLTKAIAYHGLGHYIYAGEDIPSDTPTTTSAAPTGAFSTSGGSTPPATTVGPVAPPPAANDPGAPTVFYPTGDGYVQAKAVETIANTFLAFIPTCTSDQLTHFYANNRGARDYLLAKSPEWHKKVLDAFSAAKRAFNAKEEPGEEITSLKPEEPQPEEK
ncbi:MAG: DUF1071 domain-containing protein [Pseudomonas sp.]